MENVPLKKNAIEYAVYVSHAQLWYADGLVSQWKKTLILYFIMRNSDKSIGIDAIVRDAGDLYAQIVMLHKLS